MVEVVAIRELTEEEALSWLRAQPNSRITLPPAELGRRWAWPRYKVTRRVKAWSKAGHVTRRGNTVKVADEVQQHALARKSCHTLLLWQNYKAPASPLLHSRMLLRRRLLLHHL